MQKIQNQKQTEQSQPPRSPNLLNSSIYQTNLSSRTNSAFTALSKTIIILLELLLVLSLVIENAIDKEITTTQDQVNVLAKNLQNRNSEVTKIEKAIRLIDSYKQLEAGKPLLSGNINLILSGIPKGTMLRHIKAQTGSVSVSVDSNSPLDVAIMISIFLENKNVRQITLNKVDFNVAENLYSSDINVEFK